MNVGCYVCVSVVPDAWEGSGESLEERMNLVGHIGVVLELDEQFAFVRFPRTTEDIDDGPIVYERNFERHCLSVLSSPVTTLPDSHY